MKPWRLQPSINPTRSRQWRHNDDVSLAEAPDAPVWLLLLALAGNFPAKHKSSYRKKAAFSPPSSLTQPSTVDCLSVAWKPARACLHVVKWEHRHIPPTHHHIATATMENGLASVPHCCPLIGASAGVVLLATPTVTSQLQSWKQLSDLKASHTWCQCGGWRSEAQDVWAVL